MQVAGCSYNIKRLAGLLLFMTAVLLSAGQVFAAFNVNISGNFSTGGSWAGTVPDSGHLTGLAQTYQLLKSGHG